MRTVSLLPRTPNSRVQPTPSSVRYAPLPGAADAWRWQPISHAAPANSLLLQRAYRYRQQRKGKNGRDKKGGTFQGQKSVRSNDNGPKCDSSADRAGADR